MDDTDDILLEGLKKGDEKAYAQLYEAYYKNLVVYCFNLTNSIPQAEDIVQSTLIKIWDNRANITIESSLKKYLFRAVFNRFSSDYRKRQKEEIELIQIKNEILSGLVQVDDGIMQERIKLVEKAIEQLPQKCKKVFLLNKKQGYRYKEIAAQLKISEKTVEKHISRAIYRIKQLLLVFILVYTIFNAV